MRKPLLTLLIALGAWMTLAAGPLAEQWRQTAALRAVAGPKTLAERADLLDYPAYRVARDLERVIPENGCVAILAQAGRDAINYYRARLRYELYPMRVEMSDDSAATVEGCEYVAVFRDTPQNLAQSPFVGTWDEAVLRERLREYERAGGEVVELYRVMR